VFAGVSDEDLLNYGIPSEWLEAYHSTEDTLFDLTDHLRAAQKRPLELATGGKPQIPQNINTDPFSSHPDAQRFRVLTNVKN